MSVKFQILSIRNHTFKGNSINDSAIQTIQNARLWKFNRIKSDIIERRGIGIPISGIQFVYSRWRLGFHCWILVCRDWNLGSAIESRYMGIDFRCMWHVRRKYFPRMLGGVWLCAVDWKSISILSRVRNTIPNSHSTIKYKWKSLCRLRYHFPLHISAESSFLDILWNLNSMAQNKCTWGKIEPASISK